jgi:muconolactone delta-isomerase
MPETEPLYFKEFKNSFKEFRSEFLEFKVHIDKKIESEINGLALIIKDTVATKQDIEDIRGEMKEMSDEMATKSDVKEIWQEMATKSDVKEIWQEMATKSDVTKILAHIGKYEVRTQNNEEILLQDHKPRIINLEKKALA